MRHNSTLRALCLVMIPLGWLSAQWCQRTLDPDRRVLEGMVETMIMPSADTLPLAWGAYRLQGADYLWMRAALVFGERWQSPDEAWLDWLEKAIEGTIRLDPQWRTPYFFGGSFMRSMNRVDVSTTIFTEGGEAFPDDFYFPFSVGMNHLLYSESPEQAVSWIERAAAIPGAPSWYAVAARTFMIRGENRKTAMKYLRQQIEEAADEGLKESLTERYNRLLHEDYSERLQDAALRYEEERGVFPERPEDLVGVTIQNLPSDPLEGEWILDVDLKIRSSVEREKLEQSSRRRGRKLIGFRPD